MRKFAFTAMAAGAMLFVGCTETVLEEVTGERGSIKLEGEIWTVSGRDLTAKPSTTPSVAVKFWSLPKPVAGLQRFTTQESESPSANCPRMYRRRETCDLYRVPPLESQTQRKQPSTRLRRSPAASQFVARIWLALRS